MRILLVIIGILIVIPAFGFIAAIALGFIGSLIYIMLASIGVV